MTNEQEREAFEAWFEPDEHNRRWVSKLRRDDVYDNWATYLNGCWQGWQARAALASQAGQEPVAWLCEFLRENDTVDRQVVMEDPECTRWADVPDGDGVSPFRVTPLYAAPIAAGEPHTEVVPASSVQRLMGDLQKRSDECEGVLIHIHRDELRKLLAVASGVPASDEPERLEPHSPPGLHLASNFYGFLRRHAHSLKDPTRGAVEQAAELIDRQRLEIERLGRELEAATSGVPVDRSTTPAPADADAPVVQVVEPLTSAARDVLAERQRQISAEGWTPEHDDEHAGGSMAFAAAAYAVHADVGPRMSGPLWNWTGWSRDWWKPKDKRRDLVRAGALILAEIERLDRKENT